VILKASGPNLTKNERYYRYAFGHLSEAVSCLCIGTGTINGRLYQAFQAINKIDINSLPGDVRDTLQGAQKEATKFKKDGEPDLQTTLSRIRSATGAKIAALILKAKTELEFYIS
jgi:hypothetical protein